MISDWYFCCCIDAAPFLGSIYLSILDTLEDPESDAQMLALAIQELQKTPAWMQVYALQHVLATRHLPEYPAGCDKITRRYITGIMQVLPEEIFPILSSLLDALFSPSTTVKLGDVQDCLKDLQNLPERISTTTPYLDLLDFLPETLLLAVISDQCQEDQDFASAIASEMDQANAPLRIWLEKAFRGEYGRLPLRLSARVLNLMLPTGNAATNKRLLDIFPPGGIFEPDLLHTAAEWFFGFHRKTVDSIQSKRTAEAMLKESWAFRQFAALREASQENADPDLIRLLLERVGISAQKSQAIPSLPLLFWQCILWEMATEIELPAIVPLLARFWMPHDTVPETPFLLTLRSPLNERERERWKDDITALLSLHEPRMANAVAKSGSPLHLEYQTAWTFMSPWLRLKRTEKHYSYPDAGDPLHRIRLNVCVCIAIRILQKVKLGEPVRFVYAALIAHCADLIDKDWKIVITNPTSVASGSSMRPLITLLTFGQRQVEQAGKGRIRAIRPLDFRKILDMPPPNISNYRAGDWTNFKSTVLPAALMRWIASSYGEAIDSDLQGRWHSEAWRVYEEFIKDRKRPLDDQFEAACVMRFLYPDERCLREPWMDWRLAGTGKPFKPLEWRVDYKLLLIRPSGIRPKDWIQPNWVEPVWDDVNYKVPNKGPQPDRYDRLTPLARALERLEAFAASSTWSETERELSQSWRVEWRDRLDEAFAGRSDVLGFLRLRLLELLESPIFQEHSEEALDDLERIALTLLEYGEGYELKRLFHTLFDEMKSSGVTIYPILRHTMLKAMFYDMRRRRAIETEESHRNARDPWVLRKQYDEAQVIHERLLRIAYEAPSEDPAGRVFPASSQDTGGTAENETLHELQRRLHVEYHRDRTDQPFRTRTVPVEYINGKKQITLENSKTDIPGWALEAAVFNPNYMTAKLFYTDVAPPSSLCNFFEMSENDVESRRSAGEFPVLAIVVDLVDSSDNSRKMILNCGTGELLSCPVQANRPFCKNDYVQVYIKSAGPKRWQIAPQPRLRRQYARQLPGDMSLLSLEEKWDQNDGYDLRLFRQKSPVITHDRRYWEANRSRLFLRDLPEQNRDIFAICAPATLGDQQSIESGSSTNRWMPHSMSFLDLLLRQTTDPKNRTIVLAFIEAQTDEYGRIAWLFSTQPGENYLLSPDVFENKTARAIKIKIHDCEKVWNDAHGLLVSVIAEQAVQSGDAVEAVIRLKLSRELGDSEILTKHYPGFRAPFDMRNLEWNTALDTLDKSEPGEETLPALLATPVLSRAPRRAASGDRRSNTMPETRTPWVIALGTEIPGYPSEVEVWWLTDAVPPDTLETAECIGIVWSEEARCRARVEGEWPGERRLNQRAWNLLIDVKIGDIVSLSRVYGTLKPYSDGHVYCSTREYIDVLVASESLTMRAIDPLERLDRIPDLLMNGNRPNGNRPAEITECHWNFQATVELAEDDLPDELRDSEMCLGLLTSVPSSIAGSRYKIAWRTPKGFQERDLVLNNVRPAPGWRIVGMRTGESWEFALESYIIRAVALWKSPKSARTDEKLLYLDDVEIGGILRSVAESTPGILVEAPSLKGRPHLASSRGKDASDGTSDRRAEGLANNQQIRRTAQRPKRGIFEWDKKLLAGNCSIPARDLVIVDDIFVTYRQVGILPPPFSVGSDVWGKLLRRFRIHQVIVEEMESTWESTSTPTKALEDYLSPPPDKRKRLRATYSPNMGLVRLQPTDGLPSLRIPSPANPEEWTPDVPLAEKEGTYVYRRDYPPMAHVVLLDEFEENELHEDVSTSRTSLRRAGFPSAGNRRIRASFRRVPPLTVEEFRREVGASSEKGKNRVIPLRHHFYIGRDQHFRRDTGEPISEPHHWLEFGYGKTVIVPESRLRFNNREFSQADILVYHGDRITNVSFSSPDGQFPLSSDSIMENDEENPIDGDQDRDIDAEETLCLMNVDVAIGQYTEGRSLYRQRERHKIVHILHLKIFKDRIDIDSVIGFDEESLAETRDFTRVRTRMTLSSEQLLLRRWRHLVREEHAESGLEKAILGHLNETAYMESIGEDILFDHVRFSFEESDHGNALKSGDRVFLAAGDIFPIKNDLGIRFPIPDFLAEEDKGQDMRRLKMPRRNLSVRHDWLFRRYSHQGKWSLNRHILLPKLEPGAMEGEGDEKTIIYLSMINRNHDATLPPRRIEVLEAQVADNPLFLAAVGASRPDGGLLLELQPGVFVELAPQQVRGPKSLPLGSIVRVEADPERQSVFRLTLAAHSDLRYIPKDGVRPIVALPKDQMLKAASRYAMIQSIRFWNKDESFTLGGLPDISARPASFKNGRWEDANPERFCRFMQDVHPKLAVTGRDAGQIKLAPFSGEYAVGSLKYLPLSDTAEYVPVASLGKPDQQIQWRYLTFGDESVQNVIERAKTARWTYHDKKTVTWAGSKGEFIDIDPSTIEEGPLFFETSSSTPEQRLRYSDQHFLRFGYPVAELILDLGQRTQTNFTATYPVVAPSAADGLWIELAPGRIVEIPALLIVSIVDGNQDAPTPLTNLHWSGFAAGDRVTLQLVRKLNAPTDMIALLNWEPGLRRVFGNRIFLPVMTEDTSSRREQELPTETVEVDTVLTLGAAPYILQLPMASPDPNCKAVILNQENTVVSISKGDPQIPNPEDTILLGIDDTGTAPRVVALGLEHLRILLYRPEDTSWQADPLTRSISVKRANGWSPNFDALNRIIQSVGNALPAIVKSISSDKQTLYISFQNLLDTARIPSNKYSQARVVGLLPDGDTVILRCGGGLTCLPVKELVLGLPQDLENSKWRERRAAFYTDLVDSLKRGQVVIWLRADKHGNLQAGLQDEAKNAEIRVNALAAITSGEKSEAETGLICRGILSRQLYYLPNTETAWVRLSRQDLKRLFLQLSPKSFLAVRTNKKNLSIVRRSAIRHEFQTLTPGSKLTVRIVERLAADSLNTSRMIVQPINLPVFLECIGSDQKDGNKHDFVVEVTHRDAGTQRILTVVPDKTRKLRLDLPAWMYATEAEREEYLRFERSRTARSIAAMENDNDQPPLVGASLPEMTDMPDNPYLISILRKDIYSQRLRRIYIERQTAEAQRGNTQMRGAADHWRRVNNEVKTCQAWINIHQDQPEIALTDALQAILLLHWNSQQDFKVLTDAFLAARSDQAVEDLDKFTDDWAKRAFQLTLNIGRRALRSMHAEVLARQWMWDASKRKQTHLLYRKLRTIENNLSGEKTRGKMLNDEMKLRYLYNFCASVELRDFTDLFPIAQGLIAASGKSEKPDMLIRYAEITSRLIALYRKLPLSSYARESVRLNAIQIRYMEEILEEMLPLGQELILLDPLPPIMHRLRS